jgi:hypothetical protein
MKKLLLLLFIGALFYSCNKNEECCTIIDVGIFVKYLDDEGTNILDTTEGIASDSIKLFYKKNGEWQYYFNGNMDYSKGFKVIEMEGENYLKLFPSDGYFDDVYSETKIAYTNSDFDVLKCEFYFQNSNTFCVKIWVNDSLTWDDSSLGSERIIEIIK